MTIGIFNSYFWEERWEKDPNTSLKLMKKAGLGSHKSIGFDKWAKNYNENSFTTKSKQRTRRIMKWIENQINSFENLSILDVGAASGIFSIPFAQAGAKVTSLEPSQTFINLLENNAEKFNVNIDIINEEFEKINTMMTKQYDLVFASMCPSFSDWNSVLKAINLSKKYVYISLMAGPKENKLIEELIDFLKIEGNNEVSDMYYLTQILYFRNFEYQTLIEYHEETKEFHINDIIQNLETWFIDYKLELTGDERNKVIEYLKMKYDSHIKVTTGGKFGKVFIYK